MKLIAVGDIHGRDTWKKVAEANPDFDMFVFVGDYFDNFPPMTANRIIKNFKEIMLFKRLNPDKVHIGIGNHELHYMHPEGDGEKYSGYNADRAEEISDVLADAKKDMNPAFQHGNMLFTHAGLSKTWADMAKISPAFKGTLAEQINERFWLYPELFRFNAVDRSGSGEHKAQSPVWIRPHALVPDLFDEVEDLIQVVGHTGVKKIQSVDNKLILLDAPKTGEYLLVVDGVANVGSI
jgi:hypothetical protein